MPAARDARRRFRDADAGAYAGLALGLQVVLQSIAIPLLFRVLH